MTGENFMPIERYYALKAIFERIWGEGTYLDLKHCSDLKVWKRYCERTLRATALVVSDTVRIADDEWRNEMAEIVEHGIGRVKSAEAFDELFQCLAATYVEASFLQLGFMPNRHRSRARLRKGDWCLDGFRSVQYVQSAEQKDHLTKRKMKREAT